MRFSVAILAALAWGGCGGGGESSLRNDSDPSFRDPDPTGGTPIKLSYVRFDPQSDAQGRPSGWKHAYKYMLSTGWMNKRGPSPREPFERLWRRDAYVGENIHDARMLEMVEKLEGAGLHELRETQLNAIDLDRLRRIEQTNDKDAAIKTRIITVETEKFRKTVTSNENSDPESAKKFRELERLVVIYVFGNTIQVTKDSQSTMPRGRQ